MPLAARHGQECAFLPCATPRSVKAAPPPFAPGAVHPPHPRPFRAVSAQPLYPMRPAGYSEQDTPAAPGASPPFGRLTP
ncbi:hypothetical protein DA2_1959 [Desulfovibrio sp. A2]|nr:hypothetical protein DA2_1959 [Desulfovibrio sp. A2]